MNLINLIYKNMLKLLTGRSVKTKYISFMMLMMAVVLGSCYYDKEELLYPQSTSVDCNTISAKYSTDISVLMQNKCTTSGCHDAATSAGGTVLETYTQVAAKADEINQRCIISKDMPPGTSLTQAEINSLKCWLSAGAPNN